MNAHNGSDHKPGDAWVAGIPRSRLLSVPMRIDFLSQRKKLGASAAFAADRAWVWRKPKDQTRRHLTKNLSQGSINQQIFPLIPERFLSELPEPPLSNERPRHCRRLPWCSRGTSMIVRPLAVGARHPPHGLDVIGELARTLPSGPRVYQASPSWASGAHHPGFVPAAFQSGSGGRRPDTWQTGPFRCRPCSLHRPAGDRGRRARAWGLNKMLLAQMQGSPLHLTPSRSFRLSRHIGPRAASR